MRGRTSRTSCKTPKKVRPQSQAVEPELPFRVVGIGASAGGLEAFSELLRYLPAKTGMAFVFIQHLEPKQRSRLPEILSRITTMPVEVATEGLIVQANHVYAMPATALIARSPSKE